MSEIPEDIRRAANALTLEKFDDEDRPVWMHRDDFIEFLARALLAHERATIERCAKIAGSWSREQAKTLAMNVYGLSEHDAEVAQNTACGIEGAIRETAR